MSNVQQTYFHCFSYVVVNSNIAWLEQAYDGFNRGAKLPRLDQGGIDRNPAQSPNDANMYPAM